MEDRAPERVSLEEDRAIAALDQTERRADPGGTGADHDRVVPVGGAAAARHHDVVGGLAALPDGVAHQAHPAELPDHVDALARRLEVRIEERELDAPPRAAEHELDRADRARLHARAVADAGERVHELRFALDDLDDQLLRAGPDAPARTDADVCIDLRMERVRDGLAQKRHGFHHAPGALRPAREMPAPQPVEDRRDEERREDGSVLLNEHHRGPTQ